MAPRIIHRVCYGSDVPMNSSNKFSTRPAILHDHIRKRVKYADYPGVIPTKGSTVRGTYVTGLTLRHIDHLDAFEGGEYTRQRVSVRLLKEGGVERSGEGSVEVSHSYCTTMYDVLLTNKPNQTQSEEEFLCETYIYTHPPSCLEDREWDFAEFMCEKQHNWVGDAGETDYEGERESLPQDSASKKARDDYEAEEAAYKEIRAQKADTTCSP